MTSAGPEAARKRRGRGSWRRGPVRRRGGNGRPAGKASLEPAIHRAEALATAIAHAPLRHEPRDLYYRCVEGVQAVATTRLGGLWEALERIPPIHRLINGLVVDISVGRFPTRPNPLSTLADYTSWASLTDRTYSNRHLPPHDADADAAALPPVDAVADLFTRDGDMIESPKSTVLFPYFAQWFVDGFLRSARPARDANGEVILDPVTGHPSVDPARNESNHEIDLIQIYGLNAAVTRELRAGEGGRLLSQMINGEEYPPYLYAGGVKQFDTVTVVRDHQIDDSQRRQLFALGSDTGNLQVGFVLMSVLFLREHNRIARALEREYGWDDERLFQTARNILTVILIKIVVEEYINHISPSRFRFLADPRSFRNPRWYRPNWMAVEFNLLYRWHSLVPPSFRIGGEDVPLGNTLFNTDVVVERGLGLCFEDASSQPAGQVGLFNTAPEIRDAEIASVLKGRAVRLRSYNEYRRLARLPRQKSFEQISNRPLVRERLREVYGDVDAVEFYPGLFAEDVPSNAVLPPLINRMVAADAFSQAFTNPLLSARVFNEETFSPLGWKLIAERQTLSDLLHRNVPDIGRRYAATMTRPDWVPA